MRNFNVKRKEFCYAGKWSFNLKMKTGDMYACYSMGRHQNIFKDVSKKIIFEPVGKHCGANFCFNSSHFLSLGVIPELNAPTYADLRNREEADWYNEEMKKFLGQKFADSQLLLTNLEKGMANLFGYRFRCISILKKLVHRILAYGIIAFSLFTFIGCSKNNISDCNENRLIHFSIDDVNAVFKDITENESKYSSLFDQRFFKYLKKLHDKYDAKVTLYCFYDFNGFCLKDCTNSFSSDFKKNADWLKLGYHAYNSDCTFVRGGVSRLH